MKAVSWIYRITIIIFCLLSILPMVGLLAFGHGLGDLVYAVFLWFSTLILLFIAYLYRKTHTLGKYISIMAIFLPILIFIVYKATLGRGPEYAWDGNVFFWK
ncbi:hypothetical protein OCK74_27275 [Chitinophagaceae bacterium LB-8]|uniref:Uncharacterized protein n=1 Tax=Paraflavisolibacter caeni TaxID=2982496 RepID=A0A9X2Y0E7_9BACT|nr:hypothetical protein [Paraflavisolibacter caeni]MCU7552851.1 hypothetical protein [Paraflavisolibacter caeni]